MISRIEKALNDIVKLNVKKEVMDKFNLYSIIVFLCSMMVPRIIFSFTADANMDNIYYYIFGIFILIFTYIFIYNIKHRYHKNSIDFILLTSFLVICLISTIFSFNPWIAFFGNSDRKTGFLVYILYYLLFVDAKNINNPYKLIKTFYIIGFINVFFAFLQVYLPTNRYFEISYLNMGFGLMGNPNFLATFCLLLTVLSLILSLYNNEKFYKVATIVMYAGLIFASSSGPFYTFILLLIVMIIWIFVKRRDLVNKIIIYLAIFVFGYACINYSALYVNKNIYGYQIDSNATLSGDISKLTYLLMQKFNIEIEPIYTPYPNNDVDANNVSSGRLMLYKQTIKYINRGGYWYLGIGPDNMNLYYMNWVEDGKAYITNYDKAHNIYLNMIAETGIFSLIIYILWIISYHKKALDSQNILIKLLLFAIIGYNIQGLLNINVFTVAPYYYIIIGMITGMGEVNETRKH